MKMFHVKPHEASEAETNTFVSISEPIKVGRRVSKHTQGESSDHTCVDIAEPKRVGSEGANTAKVSKQKDNHVFLFGNRRV